MCECYYTELVCVSWRLRVPGCHGCVWRPLQARHGGESPTNVTHGIATHFPVWSLRVRVVLCNKMLIFDSSICVVVFSKEGEAKKLVRDAIAAGIFNDLGSGSNIDLCVITKGNVDYIRPHDEANKKGVRWGHTPDELWFGIVFTDHNCMLFPQFLSMLRWKSESLQITVLSETP